jgi:hypothetical protein
MKKLIFIDNDGQESANREADYVKNSLTGIAKLSASYVNEMEVMELKLQTKFGELTGVFMSEPRNCYQDIHTAWFKEQPNVIVQANSVSEAIDELYISLHVWEEFKIK